MPRRTTPTLTEAAAEWETTRSHCSPVTLQNERLAVQQFIRGVGDRQIHTLTARQVEGWFLSESKRVKASSYNKTRARVRGYFDFCTRRGYLTIDPLGEVRAHRVVKREWLRLSPAELLELPSYAPTPRDKALIVLCANTALRANSVREMRIRDVDLANGSLLANLTKTSQQDVLPITSELDEALREWLREYQEDAGPLQPDWYLFPRRGPGQGRFLYKDKGREFDFYVYGSLIPTEKIVHVAQIIKKALSAAGHVVNVGEGAHTIRRSVARAFFDANVAAGHDQALRMTSALLGHSSSHTTEDYLGISAERLSRDKVMRGQSFLGAMVSTENVTPIDAVRVDDHLLTRIGSANP